MTRFEIRITRARGRPSLRGLAMVLSVETSRACGYLQEFPGEETIDGSNADKARREVRKEAQKQADTTGGGVEVFASGPDAQDWIVDCIEPSSPKV